MSFLRFLLFACLFLGVLAQDKMLPGGLNVVGDLQERMYSVLSGISGGRRFREGDRHATPRPWEGAGHITDEQGKA